MTMAQTTSVAATLGPRQVRDVASAKMPTLGTLAADQAGIGRLPMLGLCLILGIAAAIRFYGLGREGFWGDEYAQVQLYKLPLHYTCWYALTRHWLGPLDFIIGWFAYRVDPSEWMCRFPAAMWGVIAVGACFFLARQLATWREGLMAAALMAVCPMHLVLSQDARPYSICLAMILVMLVLFLRAFEKPSYRRVALYGLVAYGSTLTRTFTPAVFLLVIGLVLSAAVVGIRRSDVRTPVAGAGAFDHERRAVRRLWVATLAAGLAALPMMLFLAGFVAQKSGISGSFMPNAYGIDVRLPAKLVNFTGIACRVLFENYGPWVLGLACVGGVLLLFRWRSLPLATRCMTAIMLIVGPAILFAYTYVSGVLYLYDRYNFHLMPIVATLAAIGFVAIVRVGVPRLWSRVPRRRGNRIAQEQCSSHEQPWYRPVPTRRDSRAVAHRERPSVDRQRSTSTARSVWKRIAVCAGLAATFAYPALMSADEMRNFRRRDWRGCAAYLSDLVTPDDVVMVLTDQPFGRVQKRFFGKYEWTPKRRPLGEAMWTLAISDSHFQRLCRQSGRVYTVIAYPVDPQPEEAYRSGGLREAPAGYRLEKFRGLDLLIRDGGIDNLMEEVVAICGDLLKLPRADPSTNIVPLILRSRIQFHLGNVDEGEALLARAAALVVPIQADYFERATVEWVPRGSPNKG